MEWLILVIVFLTGLVVGGVVENLLARRAKRKEDMRRLAAKEAQWLGEAEVPQWLRRQAE